MILFIVFALTASLGEKLNRANPATQQTASTELRHEISSSIVPIG
jgi:hypothetical protein